VSTGNCSTLVYFVGGLNDPSPGRKNGIEIMLEAVRSQVSGIACCEIHHYSQRTLGNFQSSKEGPTIPVFTGIKAEDHAEKLAQDIDALTRQKSPDNLIIIAYSSGTAILRHAIAIQSDSAWVKPSTLKKIIHIGGMTTGWEFNSEMPKKYLWLGPIIRPLCPCWLPWQIYRGSEFITETRISLTKLKFNKKNSDSQKLEASSALFNENYLVGTKDEFITPADAIELGGVGNGDNPSYLEVAGCTHTTILSDNKGNANQDIRNYIVGEIRRVCEEAGSAVDKATSESSRNKPQGNTLSMIAPLRPISPDDIDDYLDPLDNEPLRRNIDVDHVFIVLHGIRDNGYWAKRIGSIIKDAWRESDHGKYNPRGIRVVSPSYGYFSLWDFVRPGGRKRAVEWFQNIYANIVALYPSAEISFIGHSNGTYLGAHALNCRGISYKYMILAGSVLRQDFWKDHNRGKAWKTRVEHLFNFRSLDDWIVAFLPGGLEMLPLLGPLMNLGGAGAYGFDDITEGVEQRSIKGGHGAAIEEDTWKQLAKYVVGTTDGIGSDGHLEPVNPGKSPALWTINRLLKWAWAPRALGGIVIVIGIVACFLPLIVPLMAVLGLPLPCILHHYPLASMLVLVLISATAFSCLRNI